MKRPLFLVAVYYVTGVLLAFLPVSLEALFAVATGFILIALAWSRARAVLLCGLLVLAGWINLAHRTAILSPNDLRVVCGKDDRLVSIRGILRDTPEHRVRRDLQKNVNVWSSSAAIEVTAIRLDGEDWKTANGRITTTTREATPATIFAGQTVELSGVLRPAQGPVAEGLFDYRNYLQQQGIYYQMAGLSNVDWQILSSPRLPPLSDRFSAWARKALARGLPEQDQSLELEWALTLGWKSAMTEEVSEPFVRAATYHIFAVDGLRIAIISAILLGLFRATGIPRSWCGVAAIPFILFYAAITGWPASAIRAIVMISVVFFGWMLKRPSDLLNSLYAAALIILVWEPRQLFQAGFQLSFFVVLCIILILPFFNQLGERIWRPNPLLPANLQPRWQRAARVPVIGFLDLLLTSTAAWLGSIPLVAWYFHIVTPLSGLANVPAIPLCGLVLTCNLSSLLVAVPLPFVSELFDHAGWLCMEAIRVTSQWSADWPGAYFYVPMPGYFTIGLYYAILLAVFTGWMFKGSWRKWKIAAAIALIGVWCGNGWWHRGESRMTILPLNGGFATFADLSGRQNDWLIDCGSTNSADGTVKQFLRAQGVNRLSHLVLTHGESGYTGGAQIIEELFQPRNIHFSAVKSRAPAYRNFLYLSEDEPAMRKPLCLGESIGPWKVLYPGPDAHFSKGEDNALVLRGQIGGLRVLLLSDLGHAGQNMLLNRATNADELRADIVVAGVPSTGEPLNDALLDAIQPRVIVVADSEYPAERRASPELKQRLQQRKVPVLVTRDCSAVTISIHKNHWQVRAMDGASVEGMIQANVAAPSGSGSSPELTVRSNAAGQAAAQTNAFTNAPSTNGAAAGVSQAGQGPLAFGQAMERPAPAMHPLHPEYLDLETGTMVTNHPPGDLTFLAGESDSRVRHALDMATTNVDASRWDATAEEVLAALKGVPIQRQARLGGIESRRTYFFKTPEGTAGILQVLPTGNMDAIIRYKLIQNSPARGAQALPDWGPAIEGLSLRVANDGTRSNAPALRADLRNNGTVSANSSVNPFRWRVEVDGVWYCYNVNGGPMQTIAAGGMVTNLSIVLDGQWVTAAESEMNMNTYGAGGGGGIRANFVRAPLNLTPGKHTVRFAMIARISRLGAGAVLVVSKPVEISVAAEKDEEPARSAESAPDPRGKRLFDEARVIPLPAPINIFGNQDTSIVRRAWDGPFSVPGDYDYKARIDYTIPQYETKN